MNDSPSTSPFIDHHIIDGWFRVAVVSKSHFICVGLRTNMRDPILEALRSGADPVETLKSSAPLGQPPHIVPLGEITSVEWHSNDRELTVRYVDKTKNRTRRAKCELSGQEARMKTVNALEEMIGDFEHGEQRASIWHTGMQPLIFSAIAIALCGTLSIAGYVTPGPVDTSTMRSRDRGLANLLNWVGPTGMLLLGLGVVAAMMTWWFLACRKPPIKMVARPVGKVFE